MPSKIELLIAILIASLTSPSDAATGNFASHCDIGPIKNAGACTYDPSEQTYRVSGSGANMWFDNDEFSFVWRKMKGDFILRARAEWLTPGVDPHRKFGWMIRKSLSPDSSYVDVAVHGDGLTSMQFRRQSGAETEEIVSQLTSPDTFQLERSGSKFKMSVAKFGDPLVSDSLQDVELGDEVYVGLFVCSHNADVTEQAQFQNVRIVIPAPDDFQPYKDYIGSRLEVLEIDSGRRIVVHQTDDSLQAPNWTRDGKALIYNRNGKLYRFDLQDGSVSEIPTGFANRNNNDHVISFDGQQLGISHHAKEEDGKSIVYVLPISGGTPTRVTPLGPSYLHGWSPSGDKLIYTAQRAGQFDIYRIDLAGSAEVRLTHAEGLDDGAEYAPDGKSIYFNSTRTGRMQIWQMKADGSQPIQVTDDQLNNWFPHISPDGKTLTMISFGSDVDPEDHPFYQHVTLRQMSLTPSSDGTFPTPKVIAYVYGGQGTYNVPSYSPDGQRIAFVSNSQPLPPLSQ